MEQLSIPYRIALVALVVIAPLYFLVLKPKSDTAAPVAATPAAVAPAAPASTGPAAPGAKGLTTAIDKAKGAVATQARSDAATQAATGAGAAKPAAKAVKPAAATAAKPAAAASAKPAVAAATPAAATPAAAKSAPAATAPAASADPSAPILAAIDRGHTEVILFAGTSATDDRAVRAAVRRIGRHGGKVDVHVVPIARVGRYEAITRGVTVQQAPTVVVVGARKAARTIVGFTTTAELNQLVGDVRRSG